MIFLEYVGSRASLSAKERKKQLSSLKLLFLYPLANPLCGGQGSTLLLPPECVQTTINIRSEWHIVFTHLRFFLTCVQITTLCG